MAKIFTVRARAHVARLFDPAGRALLRLGLSPNAVTVIGTAGVCVGAGFLAAGKPLVAIVVVTLSAFTDLLDGAMARISGTSSRFGALLDSTMDRVADGAIFGALAYWLAANDRPGAAAVALLCLVAGQIVSYVKARAEGLGLTCAVGIAERPERLIIVGAGALVDTLGVPYVLDGALVLLAVLTIITVGQRLAHVRAQTREDT